MAGTPGIDPRARTAVEDAYRNAEILIWQGMSSKRLEAELTSKGLDKETAAKVVSDTFARHAASVNRAGARKMLYGALWCIGGIGITLWTYSEAKAGGGGVYLVAWGAILYGLILFFRGSALNVS